VDATVAPLFLVDSADDLIPAAQIDDMANALAALRLRNYSATTLPGTGHSFENWPLIKSSAIAFLGATLKKH